MGSLGTFGNFPSFLSEDTLDLQVPASIAHRGSDRILPLFGCTRYATWSTLQS